MASRDQTRVNGRFSKRSKTKAIRSLSNLNNVKKVFSLNRFPVNMLIGRRVVEWQEIVEGLKACKDCGERLNILDAVSETIQALGSILKVECVNCKILNTVFTGKRHSARTGDTNGTAKIFDANTKLATAMVNAGVGERQANALLSGLNIPDIHHKTLKRRERESGAHFEQLAQESCDVAAQEEAISSSPDESSKVIQGVSCDGAWQRRGTGHNRNSLSGHVTVIGKVKRKCIAYAIAKKNCRVCKSGKHRGKVPRAHSCRKNFNGSAKAMEPHLTVSCLKHLVDKGFTIKRITMDDDSSTFARIKRSVLPNIVKCSDKNHVVKNFTSELYAIKDKRKSLAVATINYLKKCFSYAVCQNQEDPEGVKRNIAQITPHAFGDHAECQESWCRKRELGEKYVHQSLPGGRDLKDAELKNELNDLFKEYITDKMAMKLSALDSSNLNENMNQQIARKAPKGLHYSDSESLDFRVAATVLQNNEGHSYLPEVNARCGLSPGKLTEKRCKELDKKKIQDSTRRSSVKYKKRRLQLKEERNSNDYMKEIQEGKTYEPGLVKTEEVQDITTIPDPIAPLVPEKSQRELRDEHHILVFDLETTGFGFDSSITQIAARDLSSGETFDSYVFPASGFIPRQASKVTGLELHGNTMFHNSVPVQARPLKPVLLEFSKWINNCSHPVLVAHNVHFDSKVLLQSCKSVGVSLPDTISFADSVSIFKTILPKNAKGYSQEVLVEQLLDKHYEAHNAIADVSSLVDLLNTVDNLSQQLRIITKDEVIENINRLNREKVNIGCYSPLTEKKIISPHCAKKLSGSGISEFHLRLAYKRAGVEMLNSIFKQCMKSFTKIVSSLCAFYEKDS